MTMRYINPRFVIIIIITEYIMKADYLTLGSEFNVYTPFELDAV